MSVFNLWRTAYSRRQVRVGVDRPREDGMMGRAPVSAVGRWVGMMTWRVGMTGRLEAVVEVGRGAGGFCGAFGRPAGAWDGRGD